MHPYVAFILYQERLAEFERKAEIQRRLPGREPGEPKRFSSLLPRPRRRAPHVAPAAAKAHPCH